MANKTIKGARWHSGQVRGGAPPTEVAYVASNYGTALYVGQFVKKVDGGTVDLCAAGETPYALIAAIDGFYDSNQGRWTPPMSTSPKKLPASTTYTGQENASRLRVIPVVGQKFEIDASAALTTATEAGAIALLGSNADFIVSGDDCTLSTSDLEAKDASPGSAQLRVIDYVRAPDIDFTASRLKFVVVVNEPQIVASGSGL